MTTGIPLVLTWFSHFADYSDCGYCKGEKEDPSSLLGGIEGQPETIVPHMVAAQAIQVSCKQYDEIMQNGFRRSGALFYRMDLVRGCCRLYTIRTKLESLKLDKNFRKTINRFVRELGEDVSNPSTKHKNQEKYDIKTLLRAELKSSRFHTRFESNSFTAEKYDLFKRYQKAVHQEETTEASFKRFLCSDPFPSTEVKGTKQQWDQLNRWIKTWGTENFKFEAKHKRIGPTHECYYLDGKLIAFSVLDFLPSGVSSVYFVWDPDYAHLSLGTLSGLREILMCNELNLGYYYLGYYATDCPKLRYKGKFGGELLDVCNGVFVPMEKIERYLEKGKLFILGVDEQCESHREVDLPNLPMDFEKSRFSGKPLKNIAKDMFGGIYDKDLQLLVESKTYKERIQKEFDIDMSMSLLPDILPGAMPYRQLYEILSSKTINNDTLLRTFTSSVDIYRFGDSDEQEKVGYLDTIRVLGVERCKLLILFPSSLG